MITQEEVNFYKEEITKLGHIFVALRSFNRCEFICGNCGLTITGNRTLAIHDENNNRCMYCHELQPSKILENSKNKDPCKGIRQHKKGKTKNTVVFVFECSSCSKRYENVCIDRGCLDCSSSKRTQTNITKYGAGNVFASNEIKEKIVKSNQERYGVNYPMQNKEIKKKMNDTNIEKYGHKYAFNQPYVYDKIQATHTKKHGTPFPLQSPSIRDKMKENSLTKYGTEHPCQNAKELERRFKLMFRLKEYTFPSGITVNVQGYEGMCLTILLETYTEDQLVADSKAIPTIDYTDKAAKIRKYRPDVLVKETDESYFYIEVKSLYMYMLNYEKNIAKYKACIEQGIPLMVWIFQENKQGPIHINTGKRYKLYRHSYIDGIAHRFDEDHEASFIPMTLDEYSELSAQKPERKTEYTVLCKKMKEYLSQNDDVDIITKNINTLKI
jgi:hypothetical protein